MGKPVYNFLCKIKSFFYFKIFLNISFSAACKLGESQMRKLKTGQAIGVNNFWIKLR